MTPMHVYIGMENIALTSTQRSMLIAALRALGKQSDQSPANINHWRPRLDNDAAIIEAEFDSDELTVAALKQYLAGVFSIAPSQIANVNSTNVYGVLVTLSRAGTDRLRVLLFGGAGTDYATSWAAVTAYLAANGAAWGSEV